MTDQEKQRLREDSKRDKNWKRWGPYLSERQWSTVREDYSPDGTCWEYFPHEHSRSRAYRWGEDGILGITDRECRLCFALAMWNGKDPILKERLFGLTGNEGNHGEDAKECWYYLDSTPTHSYMKGLYKYPQSEFPYSRLIEENRNRGKKDPEFELEDTGVFNEERYFDVEVEYAKGSPNDILIQIHIKNCGKEPSTLHLLPTLWFRNTWSWGCTHEGCTLRPQIRQIESDCLEAVHPTLKSFQFRFEPEFQEHPEQVLFTENETNYRKLYGSENVQPYVKDSFHEHVVNQKQGVLNPKRRGTKAAPHYRIPLEGGQTRTIRLRLFSTEETPEEVFGNSFDQVFRLRKKEADQFYQGVIAQSENHATVRIIRQAYGGLMWTKQFYHYIAEDWLKGDPGMPKPPEERLQGRNRLWKHLYSRDILSVPDKWEYPWFAAWDLAFHMVPMARIDPEFAKQQMILMLREWYMHPNGQIPAYEFAFGDVNPPVHAWAAWRVYKIAGERGHRDRDFLESVFQKLTINFTWWVNRKDPDGNNLFSGGFLGLDNIGVFDRSKPLPSGGSLQQADGTAWMAFYCLTMLSMALELACDKDGNRQPAYEDMASKFFEHFVQICDAINTFDGAGLWHEEDGFYYDQIVTKDHSTALPIRSLVGLMPLIAVEVLDEQKIQKLPGFHKRLTWFLENRKDLARHISSCNKGSDGKSQHRLLAICPKERLARILKYLLDETEFLSPYGIRSLSKYHKDHPFVYTNKNQTNEVHYTPGESDTYLFGGNSNWRGPIWFPINYLLIESLERYHHFYGDEFKVECPDGSGNWLSLKETAKEISNRLSRIFTPDSTGQRPCHGDNKVCQNHPNWKDLLLFHEYFHGDTGKGLGANHQTGWTALVIRLLEDSSRKD
ncbi:MAG TPA: glucosidase [Verrucomicrobiales bacterium]|nr:glucosidase [Verrucomicrobiales bacterium]HIL72267.1 glucosidase [Verrucomicrobiota bacterium]